VRKFGKSPMTFTFIMNPIQVYDEDGTLIGDYYADLLVEGWLIVELKTAKALADEHSAQVLGYLKSARLEHGLLINFGSYRFELRKFAWSQEAARRKSKPSFLFSALCVLCVLCGSTAPISTGAVLGGCLSASPWEFARRLDSAIQ
jgi:hypothetical protein